MFAILRKRYVCLACVGLLALTSEMGCTAILISDRSMMVSPASKDSVTLASESVTIKVVPQNGKVFGFVGPILPIIPMWQSEAKNRFWLLISVLPANGEISFDPKRVALETQQGDTFLATGFSGPLLAAEIRNNSDFREQLLDAKSLNVSAGPFSVSAEVLVGVMFDTKTLDPDQPFTLVIKGLERQGHPIEVPPLKFKRERRRHFAFLLFEPLSVHKEWLVSEQ